MYGGLFVSSIEVVRISFALLSIDLASVVPRISSGELSW